MQSSSFSEQIYQQNQIQTLTTTKNLLLASAIIATIFSVPGLGYGLSLIFQIPMIALLILSIITLVFARKSKQSIVGSILSILANICSFLSFFALIYTSATTYTPATADYSSAGDSILIAYFIIGFVAWVLFVASAIVLFVEYNSTNKIVVEWRYRHSNQFIHTNQVNAGPYTQQPAAPSYQPFQQTPPQPTVEPQIAPVQNPFVTQTPTVETPTAQNLFTFEASDTQVTPPLAETPEQVTPAFTTQATEQSAEALSQSSNPFLGTSDQSEKSDNLFVDHQ